MPYVLRSFGLYRFGLALLVMLQHFGLNAAPDSIRHALEPYEVGSVAVLAFFALSGFVIAEAADCLYRGRPASFIANRLLRIAPHFILAALLTMALCAILSNTGQLHVGRDVPPPGAAAFAPGNLLLGALSLLPLTDRWLGFNFIEYGWAVRVEMAFYLMVLLCLATAPVLPRQWRPSIGFVVALMSALMLPLFVAAQLGHAPAMFAYAPYFILGTALYAATRMPRAMTPLIAGALACIAWHVLSQEARHPVAGYLRDPAWQFALLLGLLAMLALLGWGRAHPPADRLLGNLTYPLYMYHAPVLVAVLSLGTGPSTLAMLGGMAVSIAAAVVMYALVDPAILHLRDRVRGRSLQPEPAAHQATEGRHA